MTTNQTIDGVLVSRDLLERLNNLTRWHFGNEAECVELHALLDEPANRCGECGAETVQGCNDRGCFFFESGNGEPAAQPQGEPVAWLAQAVGKGGEVYRNKAATNEPTMRDIEIAWGQGVIDRFTIVIKPLYAEQPAPVAVNKLGTHHVLGAIHNVEGFPGVTGYQIKTLTDLLNSAITGK